MKSADRCSAISLAEAEPAPARMALLITHESALGQRLVGALSSPGELSRREERRGYRVPIATSVAQARTCIGRAVPDVILLDDSINAPNLFPDVVLELARSAPVILLGMPGNMAGWCSSKELAGLIRQGRVDCVLRQGDFVPLAARLIERHACGRPESRRSAMPRYAGPSVMTSTAERVSGSLSDAPADFGEVLRHEVNNPLTGILGNAELLLSRRDRISPDMVERLEIIADLAIRLRETIRRLSNALERRAQASGRIPAQAPAELEPSERYRPLT